MATAPPSTAAVALVGFFSEISSALLLRRRLFERAATDASTWRRAGLVVILAGFASDSLGLYSDVDIFLVQTVANWSLVPIMLLGLARWTVGSAAAHTVCRILGEDAPFETLMRCAGYAFAPALIQFVPALVYWLDLVPVTLGMVWTIRWLSVPWLISALTLAAMAAGVSTFARAVTVAIVLFIGGNLFDVALDLALLSILGIPDVLPLPPDAVL